MKKDLQLSIPRPCNEKWSSFTPTEQDGFCNSCQKEVIDFTKWDEEQIQAYFKTRPLHACGKFRVTQLKAYTIPQASAAQSPWWPLLMAGIITVFTSRQGLAQSKSAIATEQTQDQTKAEERKVEPIASIKVTGVVTSLEDSSTLPGVNVMIKGTVHGTTTDADGGFTLTIEKAKGNEVLVFSFIGLHTVEHAVNPTKPIQSINVALAIDIVQLGGVVVVCSMRGGIVREGGGGELVDCSEGNSAPPLSPPLVNLRS